MLIVNVSEEYRPEKKYIISYILNEFLGITTKIKFRKDVVDFEIILPNENCIVIKNTLFYKNKDKKSYLLKENIPVNVQYARNQFTLESDIPVIYGDSIIEVSKTKIVLGLDIFASCFYMLTRWEEYVNKSRDKHGRFPGADSLAYKNDFLMRPVVNEYAEMIWNMLVYLGYKGERKKRNFRVLPSHDVDFPFKYRFASPIRPIKDALRKVVQDKDFTATIKEPLKYVGSKIIPEKVDPFYTFPTIMSISEENNLRSCFYFITDRSAGKIDGDYSIQHTKIKKIIKMVDDRGHEVGLHGSYNSYCSKEQYHLEWSRLLEACNHVGVKNMPTGSRQHFLRWDMSITYNLIDSAGVSYDTSLTYADHVGFRCGICNEFPVFDFINRKKLMVRQKPLILMECTLLDKRYMNLGVGEASSVASALKATVKKYKGDFTVLWHNTRFILSDEVDLYKNIIS